MTTIDLPYDLGDGLRLRWATPADADDLAAFNIEMHSDNEPETWLGEWTKDLMHGRHPTTSAADFTVVVDTRTDKIVSSLGTISQRWTYAGIEFGVGRPELVATHPDYRRRGLVRAQMDAVHALSAARGELAQFITGIPWYYRMFGYEMAPDLGGGRLMPIPNNRPKKKEGDDEQKPAYTLREATVEDIPTLQALYGRYNHGSLLTSVRSDAIWRYIMTEASADTFIRRPYYLIHAAESGDLVGYASFRRYEKNMNLYELAVVAGRSLRAVALFLIDHLKQLAWDVNETAETNKVEQIIFRQGNDHPLYRALARELRQRFPAYAYYVRVPDLSAFLRHIAPALEDRLADSVMAGHSGTLRLNFYTAHHTLVFENGRLAKIGTYEPKDVEDGDARFPDLTFLQLLFGYRSVDELFNARADCYYSNEAAVLLDILFPKQPSWVEVIS